MKRVLLWLAVLLLIPAATTSAKPPVSVGKPQVIKNETGPDIQIPPGSPVKFDHWQDGEAVFVGQFVLTGTFVYWCEIGDCGPDEQPVTKSDLMLSVFPDSEIAARLPHWTPSSYEASIDWKHIEVEIRKGDSKIVQALVAPKKRTALLAGKLLRVQGRISIVVDHFTAGLSCDNGPYYAADFVRFAKPAGGAVAAIDAPDSCP